MEDGKWCFEDIHSPSKLKVHIISIGMNNFDLTETADFYESFIGVESFGWPSATYTNGLSLTSSFFLSPTDTNFISNNFEFPINITQLPTASYYDLTNGDVNIGSPIEGSGSDTIYVLDTVLANQSFRHIRPYNIEINFKLYTPF